MILKRLRELYLLLSPEQRRKLLRLQILVVIMSFSEIAGVATIGPFMALVGNMEQLEGDGLLADLYQASGLATPEDFLFWAGVAVLIILLFSSIFSMFTIWRLSIYGAHVGAELSSRLYQYYMNQKWLFHSNVNSSDLTNRISQESFRVMMNVILPLMQINAKSTLAFFMALAIFIYNPLVAVCGVVVFITSYLVLYRMVRKVLAKNGVDISNAQTIRFKLMSEGFGGIKDALLLGRQAMFTQRFTLASNNYAKALGTTQALSQSPRYAMEVVAFGCVIFLLLYLLASHQGNIVSILPVLSVYALAGFKLLPALQHIYTSVTQIRGNIAAYEAIREDLKASVSIPTLPTPDGGQRAKLMPVRQIVLQDISFRYPGKKEWALKKINLEIPSNKTIGFVGASGSGKSTLVDILLGLVDPEQGSIVIDDQPLTLQKKRAWQNTLGFVPQSIFLADASIKENIAFGLLPDEIDESRVRQASSLAHLDEFLVKLPDGIETYVGERGVQLSGGQRQRIGIARALYHDTEVLVLDEATSALDGITENHIMQAIQNLSGKKTIIMIAHRLATVKQCDLIYLMREGRIVDQGSYEDLLLRNDTFKRMAKYA